ncbi:hypothetical protein RHGRI_014909 [Rhododendron griersonianum]|uniref:F-box domain-containing protein n=1 Tax=Rhododendron griersonianum TaxID=479676 RepID=A0AAV6KBE2_9ERIC|nr:hypothetical protein RHGRI_014909 [Rhododendron griersonianum]
MMGSHLCLPKSQSEECERRREKTMAGLGTDCFSALPESLVIVEILSRTSPRDVCRFSAISRGFKSVADSDNVWDRFLPSDHRKIISRSVYPVAFSTKKQLYFLLADGFVLLDGGKLSFSLDKASGKKCFMLGARELAIECGRFWEQANLRAAPCFDISGKIEARLLSPKTTYVVYLLFDLGPLKYGYKGLPAKASVRFEGERGDGSGDGDGDEITNIVSLAIRRFSSCSGGQFAQQRMDKWMETELGEFFNGQGNTGEVEIRLMGFEGDYRTYDLFVEGIEIRPKIDS